MIVFKKAKYPARHAVHVLLVLAGLYMTGCGGAQKMGLKDGDRIAVIGNSLAERFQQDGWFETYLQAANPESKLVIRNLGYSGDQVHYRPRAHKGFGDSDTHLAEVRANVIFSFFGYNESFEDKPEEFRKQLTAWIDHVQTQKYDSVNTPRIVMFSPIAHEDLKTPNLPDGKENNRRLAAYTKVMEEVAAEKETGFVDLFNATQKMYEASEKPLTINGIHLNEEGNRQLAQYFTESVLKEKVSLDKVKLDSLRSAVIDKDDHWFQKYRTISGNDVWGTRSTQDGNYATLNQELKVLDVMTANRDKRIWARAQGKDEKLDDSNVPELLVVGTHITRDVTYVDPQEAISKMTFPKELEVNLFASEKTFPEIAKPVAMQVDTRGRIWVASWATYPKWEPGKPMNDRLVILSDENGDGVADKSKTFAYISHPTGFEFWNGGVIVVSAPDIFYLKDTDGDDVADVKIKMFGGIGSDDTHHSANNLIYGPDGNIYYQRGIFILENIETPWRVSEESGTPGLYRFNPRTFDFSFVVENTPNAHGISFDKWGNPLVTDGTSGKAFQVYYDRKVTSTTDVSRYEKRPLFIPSVRPITANMILSSSHFPDAYQNNFLLFNVIGFQGIKRYRLDYKEDGIVQGVEIGDLLYTGKVPTFTPNTEAAPRIVPKDYPGDPNFRPTDGVIGGDGALYFSDWQNPVITHSPYNLRDASRDHTHGRIYRVTAKNRPLQSPVTIHGAKVEDLLELFKSPVDGIRHRVRVELSSRNTDEVIKKAQAWVAKLDLDKKENALPMLEILWLHQQHNVVNRDLLTKALRFPEGQVRIAAQKVAWAWSTRESHLRGGTGNDISGMQFRTFYEKFWNNPDSTSRMTSHVEHKIAPTTDAKKSDGFDQKLDLRKSEVASLTLEAIQLRFNVAEFTVKPGQKVEITLDNIDLMPHNLVITEPGAADEIAQQAIALGDNGPAKNYVPDNKKVLFSSRLIEAKKKETLKFKAPATPGDYQFVCTFPGHAPVMRGIMKVVQ
ncbi:GDSL-type esterase/lipase family protein [Dyadobacter sp. CY327]|uniref:PVC-type heme-binding CxxCH protein n=1 Tax=Dyadobacter sp. CY327 TaxID=2907301 RepID=UPI001F2A5D77|nr:PVC-type heme-binding CxxCH protein [Dyadobacter sp. CY327]MCE7070824.1 GDSL-type esterase/lipase family protein [Dyadobacter sp. CY327]